MPADISSVSEFVALAKDISRQLQKLYWSMGLLVSQYESMEISPEMFDDIGVSGNDFAKIVEACGYLNAIADQNNGAMLNTFLKVL